MHAIKFYEVDNHKTLDIHSLTKLNTIGRTWLEPKTDSVIGLVQGCQNGNGTLDCEWTTESLIMSERDRPPLHRIEGIL